MKLTVEEFARIEGISPGRVRQQLEQGLPHEPYRPTLILLEEARKWRAKRRKRIGRPRLSHDMLFVRAFAYEQASCHK